VSFTLVHDAHVGREIVLFAVLNYYTEICSRTGYVISHLPITYTWHYFSTVAHVDVLLIIRLFLNYFTKLDDVLLVIHLSRDSVYKRMENHP